MDISDRIKKHEIELEMNRNKRHIIEKDLDRIDEKISFHKTAIWNLEIKQSKKEYDNKN